MMTTQNHLPVCSLDPAFPPRAAQEFPGRRKVFQFGSKLLAGILLCSGSVFAAGKPLDRHTIERHRDTSIYVHGRCAAIKLPIQHGVKLWNPTAITPGPDGVMYAANYTGEIFTLRDTDGDGLEDTAQLFADVRQDGLRYPTSLVFRGKELFVATTQEVRIYTDTDGDGVADHRRAFFKGFPHSLQPFDWTFGLCFGPDGWLYLNLSTDSHNPSSAPDPQRWRGAILRIAPDGSRAERHATGLRFAYGMAFNSLGDLFFTDNHGGQNSSEEINLALRGHFYGHNPAKFANHPPTEQPLVKLQLGVAPTGICFNRGDNDFGGTAGDLFAACWGPDFLFDRGSILRVRLFKQPDGTYRAREFPFAHEVPKATAIAFNSQGDLYATLFGRETPGHKPYTAPVGAIYRFVAAEWIEPGAPPKSRFPVVRGNPDAGKAIFVERGCGNCHSIGGSEEMLGPDLAGVGEIYTVDEILAMIRRPSEGIKSGFETEQLVLTDGEVVTGRMMSSSAEDLTLMTAGNQSVRVPRAQIVSEQMPPTSLMPEGLLDRLDQQQVNDLLAYLGVRDRRPAWFMARLYDLEFLLQPVFPSLRFRMKLAAGAGIVLALSLAFWRWRRAGRRCV